MLFLQRTPVLQAIVRGAEFNVGSKVGQLLRAAATIGALGGLHSRAGATQFIGPAGVVAGTVGSPLQLGFTYVGTPSSPAQFIFSGSLPPGLRFIPAPAGTVIPSGTPVISGTPTQGGTFEISVQGFNQGGLTNGVQVPIVFQISGGGAPTFTTQPASQAAAAGGAVTLNAAASGSPTFQWQRNGTAVAGGTGAALTVTNVQPESAGIYQAQITTSGGTAASQAAILGVTSTVKLVGSGTEFPNIFHAGTGFTYDQILLGGAAASVNADSDQILRMSFIDLNDDIVQVEFSGAGTLSVVLDGATGPAAPQKYNQATTYMKGHAGIVLTGANESTNLSVFSVGRAIPGSNPALYSDSITYDGFADIAYIAITSTDGKFGGLRAANASCFATKGFTGLYAPNIEFTGPVFLNDVNASDTATPILVIGSGADVRITGGDLLQANAKAVQVSGVTQLKFTAGSTSHGTLFSAQTNRARLEKDGADVTTQIVVNP